MEFQLRITDQIHLNWSVFVSVGKKFLASNKNCVVFVLFCWICDSENENRVEASESASKRKKGIP